MNSLTLRAQAEQIAATYHDHYDLGAPSVLGDTDKVQILLSALADGNYRETAIKLAGISKQTLYNWIKRAEAGSEPEKAFVDAMEKAEALAESQTVRNVRKASELPQFWAAGMTWLERKSPDRWGRRQDDASVPKVIVQLGVKDSDVTVNVVASGDFRPPEIETPPQSLGLPAPSDKSDYVNLQVTDSTQVSEGQAASVPSEGRGRKVAARRATRRGTPPGRGPVSARGGAGQVKGDV